MERENISNLPSTLVKKRNIFDFFLKGIRKKKEFLEVDKIIENLSTIKDFDTLSMSAFKHTVEKKIKDNSDATIFMSDINNLYQANKFSSKKAVNEDIKEIIKEMKEKVTQKGLKDFDVGKMGDEIYFFLPEVKEDIANELLKEFNTIKANALTLSSGFTTDLENGLEPAMKEADEKMYINKLQYKYKGLKEFCKGDINRLISHTITNELIKSRIDIDKLRNDSNKMSFVNTFDRIINTKPIDEILNDDTKKTTASSTPIIDNTNQSNSKDKILENKYKNEARYKFNNLTKEEEEKYVLAQFLSKYPVDGCVTHEYFECIEKNKLKNKKNFEVLSLDISGLKFVNDEYGHAEGDKEIENVLSNLNNLLKQEDIKTYTDIVIKGAGNAFVVIPKLDENKKNDISSKVKNCESKLGILCSINGKNELAKDKKSLKGVDLFQELRDFNEKELDVKSSEKKLKDEKNVERLIKNIHKSIFDNEILEMVKISGEYDEYDISQKINDVFKKIVLEKQNDSGLSPQELEIPTIYKSKHLNLDVTEKLKQQTVIDNSDDLNLSTTDDGNKDKNENEVKKDDKYIK